jgi:hypothetical protein
MRIHNRCHHLAVDGKPHIDEIVLDQSRPGTEQGTPVSRAHAYQMVVRKITGGMDLRLTLGRITQEQSAAKIEPDTGLQFDEGPGRNRYITVAACHYFRDGSLEASVSKAHARALSDGRPVPEAPRLIPDFLGTLDHSSCTPVRNSRKLAASHSVMASSARCGNSAALWSGSLATGYRLESTS